MTRLRFAASSRAVDAGGLERLRSAEIERSGTFNLPAPSSHDAGGLPGHDPERQHPAGRESVADVPRQRSPLDRPACKRDTGLAGVRARWRLARRQVSLVARAGQGRLILSGRRLDAWATGASECSGRVRPDRLPGERNALSHEGPLGSDGQSRRGEPDVRRAGLDREGELAGSARADSAGSNPPLDRDVSVACKVRRDATRACCAPRSRSVAHDRVRSIARQRRLRASPLKSRRFPGAGSRARLLGCGGPGRTRSRSSCAERGALASGPLLIANSDDVERRAPGRLYRVPEECGA